MFLFRRPEPGILDRTLDRARELPLSYASPGLARGAAPARYRVAQERAVIGRGAAVFARGVQAFAAWRQFDLGWAGIYPVDAPLIPGTDVLVIARHLGFWSVNACRIVYLLESADRGIAGFAYGTLTEHAEAGEEIFQLSLDPGTGDVTYLIRAVSRESAVLARLGFPIARALQERFRRDSAVAMRRAVTECAR